MHITSETSLVVQWLRLHASTVEGLGSIPGWGIKTPACPKTQPKKKKNLGRYPSFLAPWSLPYQSIPTATLGLIQWISFTCFWTWIKWNHRNYLKPKTFIQCGSFVLKFWNQTHTRTKFYSIALLGHLRLLVLYYFLWDPNTWTFKWILWFGLDLESESC